MLTNEQADEAYQQAFAALHSIVIDPTVTPEQQALAREKRDLLTLEFIGFAIDNIEERARKSYKFIGEMRAVIAAFGSSSTIAGILRLEEIVNATGELIGLAKKAATKKAAKKVAAKKAAVKKVAKKAAKKAAPGKKAAPQKLSAKAALHLAPVDVDLADAGDLPHKR